MAQGGNPPNNLTSAHIFVGNASNVPTDVAVSGDVTITNAGVAAIKNDVALAGNPTTTTQGISDNSTKIATTAFVKSVAITGPGSSTDQTLAVFSGTGGTVLADTGIVIGSNNEMSGEKDFIVTDSSTARTLSTADIGKTIYFTSNATVTVTCPNSLLVGSRITLVQSGNGQVQLIPAAGATLHTAYAGTATRTLNSEIWVRVSANSGGSSAIYTVSGDNAVAATGSPAIAGGPVIQSIQPFTITIPAGATSATLTITSVTAANAFINWQGYTGQVSTFAAETCQCDVTLTNATTVTATRAVSDASNSVTISGTVVEFKSAAIQRIQQGTIAIGSGATSNTAIITSVVTADSFVHFNGQVFSATTDNANPARCFGAVVLTNATTVTASRSVASTSTLTLRFVVVEFVASTVLQSSTQSLIISGAASPTGLAFNTQTIPLQTLLMYGGTLITDVTIVPNTNSLLQDIGGTGVASVVSSSNSSKSTKVTVIEFLSGTITQKFSGNFTIAANAASANDVIPSASTSLSFVTWNGDAPASPLSTFNQAFGYIAQTSVTQVTATRSVLHITIALKMAYTVTTFYA